MKTIVPEEHVKSFDVARVQPDGMSHFGRDVLKREEVVGHLWRSSHFAGTLQSEHQEVKNKSVVLDDERGELETADDAVRVGVVHVLHYNDITHDQATG